MIPAFLVIGSIIAAVVLGVVAFFAFMFLIILFGSNNE